MRLKSFSAPTMSLAISLVRESLGKDAIIISTRKGSPETGVTVLAAAETPPMDSTLDNALRGTENPLDTIDDILHFHRVPTELAGPLRSAAASLCESARPKVDPVTILAGALDMRFSFKSLNPATVSDPIILIGPPGSGKTVACAKLAAAATVQGRSVHLVTTDSERAGAAARLRALAEKIQLEVEDAHDPAALRDILVHRQSEVVIVDMPGVNPLDDEDVNWLRDWLCDLNGWILHVLPSGGDAIEAAEQAQVFASLGANAIVASRIDASTRYGALLAAAQAGDLPFALAGIRPQIGEGLTPLNPVSLARLLSARCHGSPSPFDMMTAQP